MFNCFKTSFIDYDVFFSYLERNHDLKVLDDFEHEEDDEEDYDDYDIEDGIHTGKEKTPSPKENLLLIEEEEEENLQEVKLKWNKMMKRL